jgi:hypothetical protein
VDQTAAEPPNHGSRRRATSGSSQKSRKALRKIVAADNRVILFLPVQETTE